VTSVHLTNAYHPTSGGIRTFYTALLDEANRAGRRVVLIVPGPATEVEDVGRFGRIHRIAARQAPAFDRRYRIILPYQYVPGGAGRALVGILEQERPDLVEICDKYSLPYLAAMLRKRWHARVPRPALVGLSCERFDDNIAAYLSRSRIARAFTHWYIRHIYGPPFDAHIANSEYTAQELRAALRDRAPGFIRVCPMGVDVDAFGPERRSSEQRTRLLARAGGTPGSVLLFYAGRLSPEKNVALLVETLRALVADRAVDCRLVLAGDGPCADWLRAQAVGELDGRIALVGNLDRATLAACCASCDLFVHPNPREPFGIGPLEAMASGVPLVAANAGGVLEYANDGNAWLAEPQPLAFASAVRSALHGDSRRIAAAIQTARRFSLRNAAQGYFRIHDELVCAHGTAPSRFRTLPAATPGGR
jgi:glycosyltransferase involved in cell wall biosynthesis